MPSRSKQKGNAFEREIAKILNTIYDTQEFTRTPSSGAIMGRSNFERNIGLRENVKQTLGSDLIVPEWFKYSCERKSYKDSPNFSQIIKGNDRDLTQWLAECTYDAHNFGLTPLLFFKTTRKGTYCALPLHFKPSLKISHYCVYNEYFIFGIDQFVENKDIIKRGGEVLRVQSLDWMLRSEYCKQLIDHIKRQQEKKLRPSKKRLPNNENQKSKIQDMAT